MVEIFDTMAAYALYKGRHGPSEESQKRKEEVMHHIKKSETVTALNEYTWIIRGFYELYYGMDTHILYYNNAITLLIIMLSHQVISTMPSIV